ncbi:pali domain containing protein [Russula decolorans]
MAPRVYFVPGIVLLFCAFILSLLVTISLPDLPTLDIVRCRFTTIHDALPYLLSDARVSSLLLLTLTTFLILFLHFVSVGKRPCGSFIDRADSETGGPAHMRTTVVTFIALLSSLSFHVTLALFASLLSFIAGLVTLTAFAFDIALFINVRDKARQARQGLPELRVRDVVVPGPGFWSTFASLILLFMATYTVWLGRRRSRMAGATDNLPPDSEKSGFFARFRRS